MAKEPDKVKAPELLGSRFTFDFESENATATRTALQNELDQIDNRISQHIDANTVHGYPVLQIVLQYIHEGKPMLKLARSLTAVAKLKARQAKLRDKLTVIDIITREPGFLAETYSAFDVPDDFGGFEAEACATEALVEDELRSTQQDSQ
jgi:hypothetical protein